VPTHSILILFGGSSDERLVSVASAQNIAKLFPSALLWFIHPNEKVSRVEHKELGAHERPFEIDFKPKAAPFAATLDAALSDSQAKKHVFLLALHGGSGENGTLQEIFERHQVAFTGSDSVASRNAFDKRIAKWLAKKENIPVAPEWEVNGKQGKQIALEILSAFQSHGELIAKPVTGGSSIGICRIKARADIDKFVTDLVTKGDIRYLIEPLIRGREITVGVIEAKGGLKALPPSEAITEANQEFDYAGKYLGKGSVEITPAELTQDETKACQEVALKAHKALACEGYTRSDMILTKTGPVFLETNTLPGLSHASFIPQQLEAAKISLRQFFEEQVQIALARNSKDSKARRA
jgi:D-alanine-D-alanine ligase